MKKTATPTTYEGLLERYRAGGQEHVFSFWDQLSDAQRRDLLAQLARIDIDRVRRISSGELAAPTAPAPDRRPAPVLRLGEEPQSGSRQDAWTRGEDLLRGGQVGILLVAGGQGSRLGFSGPKGCLPVGPISNRTLFEIHAGKIFKLRERYGAALPWYIMTSRANDAASRAFFEEHDFFGLPPADVRFFPQSMLPAFDAGGRLILEEKHRVFESPNGHGGVFAAFAESGGLEDARQRGLDHIFHFQVDNPLMRVADPLFMGLHALAGAEMSSKVLAKTGPGEKLGVVVLEGGRPRVIEYSDLSAAEAELRDEQGELVYWAGSIAIHAFSLEFLDRICGDRGDGGVHLPYHLARKRVPAVDAEGNKCEVEARKAELFVFDALPFAGSFLNLEVMREREFAPIKNPEGVDSLESGRRLLVEEHRRWLRKLGIECAGDVEISPRAALGWRDLVEPLGHLKGKRFEGRVAVGVDLSGATRLGEIERLAPDST
jgi:UDP-N-acetylglucosamine/UDP-N-acetylgalactosamine diphosphorylase